MAELTGLQNPALPMKAQTRAVTLAIAAAFLFVGVRHVDLDDDGTPAPFGAPAWRTLRSTAVPSAVEFSPGFGNFTYHDDGDNADRPVNVYYYRPDTFPGSNPEVVFTMHGSERNALSARDRMVPYADRYDALLIAPEFSTAFYPDADDYNRGFVKDGGGTGNLRIRSDWTFLTVEELFDVVQASIPGAPSRYSIQGNSAAGQFISRLALVVPEARFDVAAGSNGGWYTLPPSTQLDPK